MYTPNHLIRSSKEKEKWTFFFFNSQSLILIQREADWLDRGKQSMWKMLWTKNSLTTESIDGRNTIFLTNWEVKVKQHWEWANCLEQCTAQRKAWGSIFAEAEWELQQEEHLSSTPAHGVKEYCYWNLRLNNYHLFKSIIVCREY